MINHPKLIFWCFLLAFNLAFATWSGINDRTPGLIAHSVVIAYCSVFLSVTLMDDDKATEQ